MAIFYTLPGTFLQTGGEVQLGAMSACLLGVTLMEAMSACKAQTEAMLVTERIISCRRVEA